MGSTASWRWWWRPWWIESAAEKDKQCVYDVDASRLPVILMNKRINIVLPEATIQMIGRLVDPGQRSRFIDQAVRHFVTHRSSEALRARLEIGAVRDRDIDREVAADWFAVDHETWRRLDIIERPRASTRGAAKSTSPRSTRR